MNECPNPDAHDGSCCDGYEGQIAVLQQAVKDHADRIAALEAALRRIEDMEPATQEITVANAMAEEARAALAGGEAGGKAPVVSGRTFATGTPYWKK